MLKIGDKVRFLNETGTGIIAGFQGKNMALVLIEDGFEIPMRAAELVPVESEKKAATEPLPKEEVEIKRPEIEGKESVLIALSPEHLVFSDTFKLFLINNSHYQVAYTLSIKLKQGVIKGIHCGLLPTTGYTEVTTCTYKEIDQWEHVIVQMLFYKPGIYNVQIPLEKHVSIKTNRLQQTHLLKPCPIAGFQAHLFEIADFKEPSSISYADYEPTFSAGMLHSKARSGTTSKAKTEEKGPIRVNPKNGYMEIDLHIEELMENYSGLSNGEIVHIQLKQCKKAVDAAIQRNVGKITIIHGVGNGTLKREVQALLRSYNSIQFYEAPADKYGYGATEVLLK